MYINDMYFMANPLILITYTIPNKKIAKGIRYTISIRSCFEENMVVETTIDK